MIVGRPARLSTLVNAPILWSSPPLPNNYVYRQAYANNFAPPRSHEGGPRDSKGAGPGRTQYVGEEVQKALPNVSRVSVLGGVCISDTRYLDVRLWSRLADTTQG